MHLRPPCTWREVLGHSCRNIVQVEELIPTVACLGVIKSYLHQFHGYSASNTSEYNQQSHANIWWSSPPDPSPNRMIGCTVYTVVSCQRIPFNTPSSHKYAGKMRGLSANIASMSSALLYAQWSVLMVCAHVS